MLNLKKREDILKYHAWFNRSMSVLERKFTKEIKKVLKDQYKDAADYFSHGIGQESVDDAVDFNRKDMLAAYKSMYFKTSTVFHDKVKTNIKSVKKYSTKQRDEGEYWANLNKWMNRNIAIKVATVQATTKKFLRGIILEGVNEGLSNSQIAKNINESYDGLGRWRAMRIARTEVHSAATKATDETIKSFDLVYTKEWSASMDERTRDTHLAANGQEVGKDEYFKVGDAELLVPGDPDADAPGETVNCILPGSAIWYADVNKLNRRGYEGIVYRIKTQSGNMITVTPNHPILTVTGWKAAGLLTERDHVISTHRKVFESSGGVDIECINSSIEKVFNSFGKIFVSVGERHSTVNFHGDISTHGVDVIWANGLLRASMNASFGKIINQFSFPLTDFAKGFFFAQSLFNSPRFWNKHFSHFFIGIFNKFFSFFKSCLGHSVEHRFASISGSDASAFQHSSDNAPVCLKNPGDAFNRLAGIKKPFGSNGRFIPSICRLFGIPRFLKVSRDNTQEEQPISNKWSGYVKHFGNLARGYTVFKKFFNFKKVFFADKVTGVFKHEYLGYVYNLETKDNIYISNGIVNHNCRCVVLYNTERS